MTGKGYGLVADPFHQATVARDDVGKVINDICAEAFLAHAFTQRQTDGGGETLPKRAGRCFNTGGMAKFGMSGSH